MPRFTSRDFKESSGLLAFARGADNESEAVGYAEYEEESSCPFCDVHLKPKPSQPEMCLEIAKALLDLHPLTVELKDYVCRQNFVAIWRDKQPPRFLEDGIMKSDQIDGHALLRLVQDM